ncbi:MAG: hypothetical protein B7Y41_10860 [Hydrogenophilales bacterium 28-61-23]|nr:MAG: hypothetical protein B7Y41_10860 [Hydrogenophilales bacterium 28-61-23]
MSADFLLLASLAGMAWFWWDSLQKRELAVNAARAVCERSGVQFLDDSVALSKMRMRRDSDKRARVYREFSFDYSSLGDDRQAGRVYLLGAVVLSADLIS